MLFHKLYAIDFFDVDYRFNMTFQAMARIFQGLATAHSDRMGVGYRFLKKMDKVWFLHRLNVDVLTYPVRYDTVRLTTWVNGFRRFKCFREYLIESEDGRVMVKGTSVWLFYDQKKKRISKVPDTILSCYECGAESRFETALDDWKPCGRIVPDNQLDISLRYADFDINGHVNNTQYLGFLESLFHRYPGRENSVIKNIRVRFNREIDHKRETVRAGYKKNGNHYHCNIFDDTVLFADAEIIPTPYS